MPIVKTREAIKQLGGNGVVETAIDNKIAAENLEKFAKQNGYGFELKEMDGGFLTVITIGEEKSAADCAECEPDNIRRGTVVVISSQAMGTGDDVLGKTLMKGFIFALSKSEYLPEKILFYNGGALLTAEGSESLEDLKLMADEGVEIMTCGTCINHYKLNPTPAVGTVTNMYDITENQMNALKIIKP
jgi:selenium metabolism protein YedF